MSSFQKLPSEVQEIVFAPENSNINEAIIGSYGLTFSQAQQVLTVLAGVITGEIPVLEFHLVLAKLDLGNVDVAKMALDFAYLRLWPLHFYLGNIDRLIIRLGGKVPTQIVRRESEMQAENSVQTTVNDYLAGNSNRRNYLLTKEYIRNENGSLVEPSLQNWLKDYLYHVGAGQSDSLKRSEYLTRSPNVKALTEEEKHNLLNFLTSYGENEVAQFSLGEEQFVTVELLRQPSLETHKGAPSVSKVDVRDLIFEYVSYVSRFQTLVEQQSAALQVEIEGSSARLADIFWNALGLNERDRALTALALMAEKRLLEDTLRTDQRLSGIVRRYISVRFGERARVAWNPQTVNTVYYSLFFHLVLAEKLGLNPAEAAMTAHYLTQITDLKDKPTYIDLNLGYWRFREVKFDGTNFVLV